MTTARTMPSAAISARDAVAWLRAPQLHDDKYRRGVLGMRTGSLAYPGAAVLGVSAAWRTGAGLIRYVPPVEPTTPRMGLPTPAAAVLAARPETVFGEPSGRPCDAWVVGSGTAHAQRSAAETAALTELLRGAAPLVIDAGALPLVAQFARRGEIGAPAIVTPHRGEFELLWDAVELEDLPAGWPGRHQAASSPAVLTAGAARLAAELGVTVLLKGSLTIAAAPDGRVRCSGPATPWLATAGTGDVLAGILGALVAGHADQVRREPSLLADLGATAAHLHDAAARLAVGQPQRPITALDVADAIPHAFVETMMRAAE